MKPLSPVMALLITCENGGHLIPARVWEAWHRHGSRLPSRREMITQPAADWAARALGQITGASVQTCAFSSLVVNVDHSLTHRHLFSRYARSLPESLRQNLIRTIYEPYRQRVRECLHRMIEGNGYVVHLAMHSFPLYRNHKPRRTDVGLVYDPSREEELDLAIEWYEEMYDEIPWLRVRRNYPVRGRRDSLIRAFRQEFPESRYLGLEVHLNQAWLRRRTQVRNRTLAAMGYTLAMLLDLPVQPGLRTVAAGAA